jgi:hypothetical protein
VKESHVESHRLFELAELPAIIDQPEWNHIKHCPDCGVAFIRLVDLREGCFSRICGIQTGAIPLSLRFCLKSYISSIRARKITQLLVSRLHVPRGDSKRRVGSDLFTMQFCRKRRKQLS